MNNPSNRTLRLRLVAPAQPVKVAVTTSFRLSVEIFVSNIEEFSVNLKFDGRILEEISGGANPYRSTGRISPQLVSWRLQAKVPANDSLVIIEADADGLFQQSQFSVKVE